MPPLPVKSSGVIFERAARKLGWHPFPAPMAILSQPRAGRSACVNCGFCLGFGCEVGAKSSSLATAIRMAERTGRCEIRPNSYVHRIEADANSRATGAGYLRENAHASAEAKAVVVCANGAETTLAIALCQQTISQRSRELQRHRRKYLIAQQWWCFKPAPVARLFASASMRCT